MLHAKVNAVVLLRFVNEEIFQRIVAVGWGKRFFAELAVNRTCRMLRLRPHANELISRCALRTKEIDGLGYERLPQSWSPRHMSARRQCQRRFKHTADLGHSPLPMPSPPERRCLIFAPRLRVVCPTPDSWRAKFESSALRGIFMDNLQAAMDAPTALNVTVQAIRRREVCRSSRPREGPASWPSAFGRGQSDNKIELGGLFNWKVGRLRGRAGSPWVISCISVADHPYLRRFPVVVEKGPELAGLLYDRGVVQAHVCLPLTVPFLM